MNLPLLAVLTVAAATTSAAQSPEIEKHVHAVVNGLSRPIQLAGRAAQTMPLSERMKFYKTPGVSIAYFRDGKIVWAQGFGVKSAGGTDSVTPITLFQAASISKALAAMTALSLVEEGKLKLDGEITGYLGNWRIPANEFTKSSPPTLRQLLSHTAGFSAVPFAGYEQGAALPTTLQILDGAPPAKYGPVHIDYQPGSKSLYSNAGYVVLEQIIETVTGMPFGEVARRRILKPLGMTRSGFFMENMQEAISGYAAGHDGNGTIYKGGYMIYPETAAAGLWSTPSDLARLAIEVRQSFHGRSKRVLSPKTTRTMLARQKDNWALGWEFFSSKDPAPSFYASGSNRGYKSILLVRMDASEGVAIMTNSDNGGELFGEILAGMAIIHGWNDLKPEERSAITISANTLATYAGTYEFTHPIEGKLIVKASDGHIVIEVPGLASATVFYPSSRTKFFDLSGNIARFEMDAAGAPITLAIGDITGTRKQAAR